jgi:hypothetical protein
MIAQLYVSKQKKQKEHWATTSQQPEMNRKPINNT